MCIVSKIAEIQNTLLGEKFPKSGFNKHTKVRYHELKDILPPIVRECNKHNLLLLFNFTRDAAYLDVTNKADVEDYYRFTMPMPELTQLNKQMNVIQSLGADVTYLKRYLLIQAFLILEDDVADAVNSQGVDDDHEEEVEVERVSDENGTPRVIRDAMIDLEAKGIRITRQSVFVRIQPVLTDDNRQKCIDWINKNIKEAK